MPVTNSNNSSKVMNPEILAAVESLTPREREYALSRTRVITIKAMDGSTISKTCSVDTRLREIRNYIAKEIFGSVNPNQIALHKANTEGRLPLNKRLGDVFFSIHGGLFCLVWVSKKGKYLVEEFDKERTQQLRRFDFKNKSVNNLNALLEAGAAPDLQGRDGLTVLTRAVWNGRLDCLRVLLEAGADLDFQGKGGSTALIWAAMRGKHDWITELIDAGADPDIQNCGGDTALLRVVVDGDLDCLRELLEAGAGPDIQNIYGDTALMLAAQYGKPDFLTELIDAGADPDIQNGDGHTALMLAELGGHAQCQEALQSVIELQ